MPDLTTAAALTLFEHTAQPVAVIDRDHRILLANDACSCTFGPWQGRTCWAMLRARSSRCPDCPAVTAFEQGTVQEASGCKGGDNDSAVSFDVRAVPLRSKGKEVDAVVLLLWGRTDLDALEQRLRQADRLASVGLTAAGLAHTIKNILAGLEGAFYTVDSGMEQDDTERLRAGWEMVRKYIDQVAALVKNLLRYAKARRPLREEVDARRLVTEMIELYQDKAGMIGIEVEATVADDLLTIWADPQTLHACLANLVANALDACAWDPDRDKQHRIILSASRGAAGGVKLEVEDNGIGIADENQEKILATLFTTKGIRGTGLGLLLTRQAVQQHGGEISFSSTRGSGTRFSIELPQGAAPAA